MSEYIRVRIERTNRFIRITPISKCLGWRNPPNYPPVYLPPDCSNEQLGDTVLEQLQNMKNYSMREDEAEEYIKQQKNAEVYERELAYVKKHYGYKNVKDMYKDDIRLNQATLHDNKITARALIKRGVESWEGTTSCFEATVSADSPPDVIGEAVRSALDNVLKPLQ